MNSEDKTPVGSTNELVWLLRLKQTHLFCAEARCDVILESSPIHDPHLCQDCADGPCEWVTRQLERCHATANRRVTPTL